MSAAGGDFRAATEGGFFPSMLELPFFEERHRELAARLETWASAHLSVHDEGGNPLAEARRLNRLLAEGGWFNLLAAGSDGAWSPPDVRSLCLVRETLARHLGFADFVFAIQGLGSAPVLLAGTEAQKRALLPDVMAGRKIPAFALSEAEAGSDAADIQLKAERDGGPYVLNGGKMWISNAGIADVYAVFARTGEGPGHRGISAFLVDADTPGFTVGEQVEVIAPHVLAPLEFHDCRIPAENLIGKPGDGFKIAMSVLDIYRSTVGAAAVGFARRALQETVRHVRRRRLFGQALADSQATRMRLAEMAEELEASALLVYRSAWLKDVVGRRVTYESSLAKMSATERAQRVIDSAVQLAGGLGVRKGSVVEGLYREIRPLRIYEGATEIQKLVIAEQLLRRFSEVEAAGGNAGPA
jgi:acyl-CoA dehydrogenase